MGRKNSGSRIFNVTIEDLINLMSFAFYFTYSTVQYSTDYMLTYVIYLRNVSCDIGIIFSIVMP